LLARRLAWESGSEKFISRYSSKSTAPARKAGGEGKQNTVSFPYIINNGQKPV